ncbi:MAG: DNA-3-methyladenine glycosylase 2 family protein [Actinobacteria bacterium]|nr:DNA-3-methyladenine glycosylase 2 family protein [Actinomycetota bacterium]
MPHRSPVVPAHPVEGLATGPESLRATLAPLRNGGGDPTTLLGRTELWRATLTPDGPATVRLTWGTGRLAVRAWGPGADWLAGRAEHMVGLHDPGHRFVDAHPAIMGAQRNHPDLRIGASGTLYHELLPTIIAQRITGGEAVRQWARLCWRLGEPAPGPEPRLRLPPAPDRLAATPSWWFHPLGIERSRAETLRTVARHADRIWEWSRLAPAACATQLSLLRGVGEWTIGTVLASALGEPDAIAVGDYHLKNIVAHALTGQARGTDEQMVELLAPYRPHRGRVMRLLLLDGHRAPAFGPRQRVLPMHRW